MVYQCIKSIRGNGLVVKKGTKWEKDNKTVSITGSAIRLEEVDGTRWLEISKLFFEINFRELN